MQRKVYLLLALVLLSVGSAFAQGSSGTLKGKVTDKDNGEPLPLANIVVFLNGNLVTGGSTDFDGYYTIKPIDPGTYDVQFSMVGYQSVTLSGIPISSGKIQEANVQLVSGSELDAVEIIDFKVPLIDKDGGASGGTVTREEISKMPSRSALGLAQTVAGVSSAGTGGGLSIRGARTNSTWVYIDGIKVRGSTALPKSAIEEVAVITGGIPANIGDATGGVVNIALRSASATYTGGLEVITSGFKSGDKAVGLDHYGYNLVEGSLSGPILFRKDSAGNKTRPIVGFFVSGNYTDIVDPNPAFGGNYKMKDDVRADILANPLRQNVESDGSVNGALYNADFLTSDSFEKVKTNLNNRNRSANLVAKMDFNLSETMTLTLGGTGAFNRSHDFSYSNMLMNWDNNQQSTSLDWRAYVKFSQRFKNAEGKEASANNLKNVFYSVMVDYSRNYAKSEDDTHKDDLFKYGHIGYFDIVRGNTYEYNGSYFRQSGIQDIATYYTPSQYNPEMAAITNQYFGLFDSSPIIDQVIRDANGNIIRNPNDIYINNGFTNGIIQDDPYSSFTNIQTGNGLINGFTPVATYDLWSYAGTQNNNYSVSNTGQFRVSGAGSADIGNHAIQIGFEFEQRRDAAYAIAPVGLWSAARLYTNSHTAELDNAAGSGYDSTTVVIDGNSYVYFNQLRGDGQFEFDYRLREALGLDPNGTDYINIDNIDPEFLDVSMFGAEDLLNQGNNYVTYFGYDHTGKKTRGRTTIDDFFNEQYNLGGNSYYSRSIGAFEPIYTSGYIMDKFAFDDLIFNVGLRIDRYDANQAVPNDPYVIGLGTTVSEMNTSLFGSDFSVPSNIGSDYVVYVNDVNNPTEVTGYRNGNTWYDASGQIVTDPLTTVASSGKINPLLQGGVQRLSSKAFKDYEPVVNVMPRIAFSFPISDEALFFAHYDILTQRPTESNRFNPIDYLYMANRNVLINNPNLKPEKTVDYALGFQQILSRTSSIKLEAFYRELRNMIQVRSFVGAYPSSYRTFDNIDFGTVKGLTLTYDLRRTGNIWMKTSYTLQFADGTGSTTQTQLALINQGLPNLRTVSPFNYDQRHRIVTTVDYRYGEGAEYNGPVWFGKKVFENTGANFIANLGSGTPYTSQVIATPITGEVSPSTEGSLNGSRLPWQFSVDLQLDRNITLKFAKKEGKEPKLANLNVYLWVTNLLNTQNINGVYRFTGTPDDDGYLASAQYDAIINAKNSPDAFRNYYSMFVNNPYNYSAPRQIRLGIRLDF
ncbi:MAG: TonB-dependent receptor domain-containing protein [Flavobacteriales bacterium]